MTDPSIQDITVTEQLVSFGLRAKKEVLALEDAVRLAGQIPAIRLKAPAGNGNGQIGALAGIGLRLHGNDGTFRGKILVSEPVTETVREMKKRLDIDTIWDGKADRVLADDEIVRAIRQIKLVYRNHKPMAAVRLCEDGIYELCNKAAVYEQTITKTIGLMENCKHFKWDNDKGEQWNETAGNCMNCLHRRLTDQGMVCQRKGQGGGRKHKNKD